MKPEFLINAADFPAQPNMDSCESAKGKTLWANIIFPQTVARVCLMTNTPWGHVSSARIFSGAKVVENGRLRIEKNLNLPEVRQLYKRHPENFYGFEEVDVPNFSFRNPPCSFYSGTKALAEEAIRGVGQSYIWRIGDTFNEIEDPANLLSRLQTNLKVHDIISSISHVDDAVRACLNMWDIGAAFGIYNIINPGAISTRQIVEMIQEILRPNREFHFWKDDDEFYRSGPQPLRSHPILNVSKLLANGIPLRPVRDALKDSLKRWKTAASSPRIVEKSVDALPAS
jgi:dTDP-4-dehydrorhamnose reductase